MAESGTGYILSEFIYSLHYQEYARWWGEDNPPPKKSLPAIGLVVGDMKAIGFLANTDTDFGIMTWWYANPRNKPRESYESLKVLTKGLCQAAQLIGKSRVFCYTNKRGMIRLLESLHFLNVNGHLVRRIYNG